MTNVRRIYVEKRKEYATEAHEIQTNLVEQLGLTIHSLRIVHRYDVQGISEEILQQGINTILAEPMVDHVYDETFPMSEKESVFAIEFLPGQYDQRADSCEQCFQILPKTGVLFLEQKQGGKRKLRGRFWDVYKCAPAVESEIGRAHV